MELVILSGILFFLIGIGTGLFISEASYLKGYDDGYEDGKKHGETYSIIGNGFKALSAIAEAEKDKK